MTKWSLGSEVKHTALPGGAILHDSSRVGNLGAAWFDPQHWAARGDIEGAAGGRGSTFYIKVDGREFALRHYRRGGWVARVSADRYFWRSEQETRPFAEWQLT